MASPERIEAAIPAMRSYLANRFPPSERHAWKGLDAPLVVAYVEQLYRGGVAQFIRDLEERRG